MEICTRFLKDWIWAALWWCMVDDLGSQRLRHLHVAGLGPSRISRVRCCSLGSDNGADCQEAFHFHLLDRSALNRFNDSAIFVYNITSHFGIPIADRPTVTSEGGKVEEQRQVKPANNLTDLHSTDLTSLWRWETWTEDPEFPSLPTDCWPVDSLSKEIELNSAAKCRAVTTLSATPLPFSPK